MKKVKIIADSVSDMTLEEAEKLDIEIIPLTIIFDGIEYKDGIDITTDKLFQLMEETEGFPQTAQISPMNFYEKYQEYLSEDMDLIVITMSSKLSGTYNSANIAKNDFSDKEIYIIDSMNVTAGEYLLVKYAAMLRDEGKSAREIYRELEETKNKIKCCVYLDTLDNLARSGRINKAVEFVGTMLRIKPVVTVIDGEIIPVAKERGEKRAIQYVINSLKNEKLRKKTKVCIGSCLEGKNAKSLKEACDTLGFAYEVVEVGAVTASHIGPYALGYFLIEE